MIMIIYYYYTYTFYSQFFRLFDEKENLETSIHRKVSLSLRIETKTLYVLPLYYYCVGIIVFILLYYTERLRGKS